MEDPNAPDESGVTPDTPEDQSTSTDAPVETGVTPSEEAPAGGEEKGGDLTDPAAKLEMKKLRDGQRLAEEEAIALRERNRKLEEEAAARTNAPTEESATKTGPPEFDDYDDPAEYHKVAADYSLNEAIAKRDEKDNLKKQADAVENATVKFNEGIPEAKVKNKDYVEVARTAQVYCSDEMVLEIVQCDGAHDIVYHLGQNPSEARRIAGLSQLQRARELGKLEARFGGNPDEPTGEPTQKTITQADAPAAELPSGGTDVDDTAMTTDEFAEKRKAERAAKRGAAPKAATQVNSREARRATAVKTG
ncbi:MAG: hypothetical protein KAJ07_00450 [Planctomycetes bacterium]|nr:hypothetical protein [Planctomycetota bacterium]